MKVKNVEQILFIDTKFFLNKDFLALYFEINICFIKTVVLQKIKKKIVSKQYQSISWLII